MKKSSGPSVHATDVWGKAEGPTPSPAVNGQGSGLGSFIQGEVVPAASPFSYHIRAKASTASPPPSSQSLRAALG